MYGELPAGGISSSAALQVAVLQALLEHDPRRLDRRERMMTVVRAERQYTGVPVGLLDPAVILHARAGAMVYLDCREGVPRVHRLARGMPAFRILLVSTGEGRDLRDSPYAARVEECRVAARQAGAVGDPPVLREVDPEAFRRRRAAIDPVPAARADHVFAENKRVKQALQAVAKGDLVALGRLVTASADSLTNLFECGPTRRGRSSTCCGIVPASTA